MITVWRWAIWRSFNCWIFFNAAFWYGCYIARGGEFFITWVLYYQLSAVIETKVSAPISSHTVLSDMWKLTHLTTEPNFVQKIRLSYTWHTDISFGSFLRYLGSKQKIRIKNWKNCIKKLKKKMLNLVSGWSVVKEYEIWQSEYFFLNLIPLSHSLIN